MLYALLRGGLSLPPSGVVKRWIRLPCLAKRLGVARVFCVLALFAMLVSAFSPVEGLGRSDLLPHKRSGHRVVAASGQARASRQSKRVAVAAAAIVVGAYAGPILHSVDQAAPGVFLSCTSSPGYGRTHPGRAPPIPS